MSEPIGNLIPAAPGHAAQFEGTNGRFELPILAWANDGMPLVADGRLLARANTIKGYIGIVRDTAAPILAVVDANGWRIKYELSNGDSWDEPLVAWGVRADGEVVPLTADHSGQVQEAECTSGCRVYHPDTKGVTSE